MRESENVSPDDLLKAKIEEVEMLKTGGSIDANRRLHATDAQIERAYREMSVEHMAGALAKYISTGEMALLIDMIERVMADPTLQRFYARDINGVRRLQEKLRAPIETMKEIEKRYPHRHT